MSITARAVSQRLREAALGVRCLQVRERHSDGQVQADIEGWSLILQVDDEGLVQCLVCQTADGARADLDDWPRYGTNPTDLLSLWERQRIEHLLSQG